ncbi:hypothetical protein ABQE69_09110 [Mycolicibacillus trivialis]
MSSPVELIATNLAQGLVHPGDGKPIALPLPMFQTAAIPPDMAREFADQAGLPDANIAKLTAEAIVHLLGQNGYTVIDQAELDQLRTDATEVTGRHRQPRVHCRTCSEFLFSVNVDAEKPTVDGPKFIRAIHGMSDDCSVKHRGSDD